MIAHHFTDDGGVAASRVRTHCSKQSISLSRRHNRDQLALVGHIKWVQPENLAGGPHFVTNGNRRLSEFHPHVRSVRDLVQSAGHSTAGRISHASNAGTSVEHTISQIGE